MADKITAKELSEKKDRLVLIDVKEADEVAKEGIIEGAVNMPLGQLIRNARQGALDEQKGRPFALTAMADIGATLLLTSLERRDSKQ
jgi:rhodanese-related sulfurtransferase